MEQKKILWVMMSVSLLSVVLLGLGMFLPYLSRGSRPEVADSEETGKTEETRFDAIEYIRQGDIAGVEEAEPVEDGFVAVSDELVIGESEEVETEPPEGESQETDPVETTPPSTAPPVESLTFSPPAPRQPALSQSAPSQPVFSQPVLSQPALNSPPPSQPAAPVRVRTPKPAPVKKTVIEYWIQVGSFTKSSQAEENKEKLATEGINSVIRTKTVGETTYFRVRIGPYDNKAEAEKFLGWIQSLADYSGSYISELSVTRTQ